MVMTFDQRIVGSDQLYFFLTGYQDRQDIYERWFCFLKYHDHPNILLSNEAGRPHYTLIKYHDHPGILLNKNC